MNESENEPESKPDSKPGPAASAPADPAGGGARAEAEPGPPWILGHRGAPLEAPENTLVGLSRALEYGLDGVEYDLQACATGEPVVLHDETLDRTTDARGPRAGAAAKSTVMQVPESREMSSCSPVCSTAKRTVA